MVHGWTPEDVKKDEEGLQTMRILGTNMAWFLEMKEFFTKFNCSLPNAENLHKFYIKVLNHLIYLLILFKIYFLV